MINFITSFFGKSQTLTYTFSGSSSSSKEAFPLADEQIVEWLKRGEMICKLSDKERFERILLLRLTGGALAVYQQLTKEQKAVIKEIKHALSTTFAVDVFVAFDQFSM